MAMDSSFAGPALSSRVPGGLRRAGRSTGNYAYPVARLDLHDVTFLDATAGDLLQPFAAGQPAQVDASPRRALVAIRGDNYIGFGPFRAGMTSYRNG